MHAIQTLIRVGLRHDPTAGYAQPLAYLERGAKVCSRFSIGRRPARECNVHSPSTEYVQASASRRSGDVRRRRSTNRCRDALADTSASICGEVIRVSNEAPACTQWPCAFQRRRLGNRRTNSEVASKWVWCRGSSPVTAEPASLAVLSAGLFELSLLDPECESTWRRNSDKEVGTRVQVQSCAKRAWAVGNVV